MGRGFFALLIVTAGLGFSPASASAGEQWSLREGSIRIELFTDTLEQLQVQVETASPGRSADQLQSAELLLDNANAVTLMKVGTRPAEVQSSRIHAADGLRFSHRGSSAQVREFVLARGDSDQSEDGPVLLLEGVRASVNATSERGTIPISQVIISRGLAEALGKPLLAGHAIGRAVISGRAEWTGGEAPPARESAVPLQPQQATSVASPPSGPDVTFCELYGLTQFGRLGDVVGLAMTTTSWNIGGLDLQWYAQPDARHPFIVQNVYRRKNDRFEQIGQSWIKHGYFALNDTQCGGACTYEPGSGHTQGPWLGTNCTDTYSAGLNATQNDLGPRQEVNPWTGDWDNSHFDGPDHSHNGIAHRLQVHDADLNPSLNAGATYLAEGYYVHFKDIDVWNSASWKTFTVSGSPGGTWSFPMSGFGVRPNEGFAIDAWTGATQTVLAQQLPVVESSSPDGRCVLASKATDLGGGIWHYEYALLNIDMDRKVSSFSIPIGWSASVSNVGFHAPESHGESYSNDPWTSDDAADCGGGGRCITWSTTNNPIRWGTMYNFRFDADVPPDEGAVAGGGANAVVTLGLFEPGSPQTISGMTLGPIVTPPIPATSFWTIAALGLLVLIAGTIAVGRRARTACGA